MRRHTDDRVAEHSGCELVHSNVCCR
jgi:hypothetical protein